MAEIGNRLPIVPLSLEQDCMVSKGLANIKATARFHFNCICRGGNGGYVCKHVWILELKIIRSQNQKLLTSMRCVEYRGFPTMLSYLPAWCMTWCKESICNNTTRLAKIIIIKCNLRAPTVLKILQSHCLKPHYLFSLSATLIRPETLCVSGALASPS